MTTLRLFIHIDDAEDEFACVTALAVPSRGDRVWVRTLDGTRTVVVSNIEHQLDRASAEVYGNHDVILWCTSAD